MPFNLLHDPWLEVRRRSGRRDQIRPCDVTNDVLNDPIVALDFPRPDWNAAVTELLIGLMFIALACDNEDDWAEHFRSPPSPDTLLQKLSPFSPAFNLDGDGPRAFQDFDDLAAQDPKPVSGLLIEAPGENALRNNSDLFIKRDTVTALGLPYATAALITLQTYAPSGGAGHRTSLRGGGPLTTLVTPLRTGETVATLWDRLWANVPARDGEFTIEPSRLFPWISPTRTSVKDAMVTPEDQPLGLCFFACPRRLRLIFADGRCSLSEATGPVVLEYRTQNYGANYVGWLHPLSPYRNDKKSGALPLHPNSGPSDYGDWLAWWGFNGDAAESVKLWKARRLEVKGELANDGMIAFGFDMDNMKARQWLDARLPWVPVDNQALKATLQALISAADEAAKAVRFACKLALYGQKQGDGSYRLPETLPMDALQTPAQQVWQETQGDFERQLDEMLERAQSDQPDLDLREAWLKFLRRTSVSVFDAFVDIDGLTDTDPRRLLYARGQLNNGFNRVRTALGLVVAKSTKEVA
ncbi:type I-E CRISPR-associated protein Cse1/CasA [Asticcacaulis sp. AC402]|uniref:type I-E CRISPR-associated protein Cse1/CasA n=1 Tax=Asticcacaulis sp. AC402 TaxID=1282361 RepID=UPI0003C3DC00|nr:type I-E CRISPR-associated protein Cse1/CasA [Asticcacaulis sp. AC402]ESQ74770.1 hypothetical protein ABAC402_12760 [Asticcacaulis sp. AC402]